MRPEQVNRETVSRNTAIGRFFSISRCPDGSGGEVSPTPSSERSREPQSLDGVTSGSQALDSNGNPIMDASGGNTIVKTGLFREMARDANGNVLYDCHGYICYKAQPPDVELFATEPSGVNVVRFAKLHRILQIEYIRSHSNSPSTVVEEDVVEEDVVEDGGENTPESAHVVTFGTGETTESVYLTTENEVIFINELTIQEFGCLRLEDQRRLARLPGFAAKRIELNLQRAKRPNGLLHTMKAYLAQEKPELGMRVDFGEHMTDEEIKKENLKGADSYYMNKHNVGLFRAAVRNLIKEMEANFLISEAAFNTQFERIQKHFKWTKAFSLAHVKLPDDADDIYFEAGLYDPVKGGLLQVLCENRDVRLLRDLDGNEFNKATFRRFINARRQLNHLVVNFNTLRKRRNMPIGTYVARVQLCLHAQAEIHTTIIARLAESVGQYNKLLTFMQGIVARAQAAFTATGDDALKEQRSISGHGGRSSKLEFLSKRPRPGLLHGSEAHVVIIFQDNVQRFTGRSQHPVEIIDELTRPTRDFLKHQDYSPQHFESSAFSYYVKTCITRPVHKTYLDTYSQELSQVSSLVTQKRQTLSTEMSTERALANRYFEAATTAKKLAYDASIAIPRAIL